ncbi:MAG: MarR family transcriptional regulator [Deltaproteobacteria bacterium]|nr:MarR family transcriptional regulator [Deltaproteobacteria bacterium]
MARVYRERLDPFGLTQPQFFLLIALYECDGVPVTALAEKVALDKSTLTGLLDRMERDGLVERTAAPGDRRALRIRLSAKAQALRPELTAIYEQTNSWFLSRLTDAEHPLQLLHGDAEARSVRFPGRRGPGPRRHALDCR